MENFILAVDDNKAQKFFKGKKIFIAPYAHCDYSWVHSRTWHIYRYITILEEALDLLDLYDEYYYYIDTYSLFLEPVIKIRPDLEERLKKHVLKGKLAICGTYSSIRPNMVDGEAFIRNMIIGRKKFEKMFPNVVIKVHADACDVIASHSQLPQLVKNGGYDYMRIGRPNDMLIYNNIPLDHIYRGQDGSEILCSYAPTSGFWNPDTVQDMFTDDIEKSIDILYQTEFYPTYEHFDSSILLKGNGCDDGVPLRCYYPKERLPLVEQVRKWREAGLDMRFATPNEYFELLDANRKELKTITEPVDICEVSYNICLGGEKSLLNSRLVSAREILTTEMISSVCSSLNVCDKKNYQHLWEENLFCSAHASQWSYKDDYKNLTKRISRVIDKAQEERFLCYEQLTKIMPYDSNVFAVVFNNHDKPVKHAVRLTIPNPFPNELEIIDGFGNKLEFQAVWPYYFSFLGEMIYEWDYIVMIEVPACGYNSIIMKESNLSTLKASDWKEPPKPVSFNLDNNTKTVIETNMLKLTFYAGVLKEIESKNGVVQYAKINSGYNSFKFYEYDNDSEDFDFPNYPVREIHNTFWEICELAHNGPIIWEIKLFGKLHTHKIEQIITIYKNQTVINIETKVEYDETYGIMTMSVPCESIETLYGGIPFGIEKRRVDKEKYFYDKKQSGWDDIGFHRTVEGLFYSQDFVGFMSGDLHIGLVAINGDRYYLYDKNTNEVCHIVNATARRTPIWTYNINDIAFSSFGKHTFSHAIVISQAEAPSYNMYTKAQELRTPLEYIYPQNSIEKHKMLSAGSFISTDKENIRISAFYFDDDSYILRIWEAAGESTKTTVQLPINFKEAARTNFNGIEDNSLNILLEGNKLKININPHEIITVKLK